MVALILLSLLFGSAKVSKGVPDRFDLAEVNHYLDARGKHAYSQLIFFDYSPEYQRFHVHYWVLISDEKPKPIIDKTKVGYNITFHNRDQKSRMVRVKFFRERVTRFDPERTNKSLFPEQYRTGLKKITSCSE